MTPFGWLDKIPPCIFITAMRSLQSTTLLFTSHQYNFRISRIPSRIGRNHQLNIYKWKSQACWLGSLKIKVVRFVLLCVKYDYWEVAYVLALYRQTSNISGTLGNKVVNHPDAVEHRCSKYIFILDFCVLYQRFDDIFFMIAQMYSDNMLAASIEVLPLLTHMVHVYISYRRSIFNYFPFWSDFRFAWNILRWLQCRLKRGQ